MSDPVVELKSGFVRGIVEKHEDGFNYYSFKGIPYAEPPLGELRFEDPIPIRKWSEVKDCKNYGPRCLQYDLMTRSSYYSEDCLHLNVHTRSIDKPNVNNPVILVLYGGFGSACDLYLGPEYLIRKNIVFVTISYRLGILGYLNLEDEVAPGNQGLKDHILALRWIQQNIREFCGNPNNVTLCGMGAGGTLAHILALSPLTKGLIHKVISQSCVAYSPWVRLCRDSRSDAIKLCSILGKELTNSKEIVRFLKTVDPKTLLEAQEAIRKSLVRLTFAPGIDNKSANPVIPVHLDILANEGVHLPYLAGYTSREGILFSLATSLEEYFKKLDENPESMFNFNMKDVLDRHNVNVMQIKRLYYKSEAISMETLDNYIDFLGDLLCVESIHTFARIQAERSSAATYLYQFDYVSPESFIRVAMKDPPKGASHIDDSNYLFKMRIRESAGFGNHKKGTRDYRVMEQMTEMWYNFARYGKPTIETLDLIPVHWKPIADGTLLRYLNIDEDITMQYCVNIAQKYVSARSIKV